MKLSNAAIGKHVKRFIGRLHESHENLKKIHTLIDANAPVSEYISLKRTLDLNSPEAEYVEKVINFLEESSYLNTQYNSLYEIVELDNEILDTAEVLEDMLIYESEENNEGDE